MGRRGVPGGTAETARARKLALLRERLEEAEAEKDWSRALQFERTLQRLTRDAEKERRERRTIAERVAEVNARHARITPLAPRWPLYHGVRQRKTAEEIKRDGICTFRGQLDVQREVLKALKHFNREHLLKKPGSQGDLVRHSYHGHGSNMGEAHRRSIYASTFRPDSCSWAERNPEYIFLVMRNADIPWPKVRRYLTERFGPAYRIKLKHRMVQTDPNFSTMSECILPEDIEEVTLCEPAHDEEGRSLPNREEDQSEVDRLKREMAEEYRRLEAEGRA